MEKFKAVRKSEFNELYVPVVQLPILSTFLILISSVPYSLFFVYWKILKRIPTHCIFTAVLLSVREK